MEQFWWNQMVLYYEKSRILSVACTILYSNDMQYLITYLCHQPAPVIEIR